jgi:hypothetical protein
VSTDAAPAPAPTFTDTDLSYVRSALQAVRAAQRANRVVEDEASDPRLRDSARRSQTAHGDDIARIVSLLAAWDRPEAAPAEPLGALVDLGGAIESLTPAAVPGRVEDRRLVAALSAHTEASILLHRAEMVAGLDSAARDLAEDHIRAAVRHLTELRRVLEPGRGQAGPGLS